MLKVHRPWLGLATRCNVSGAAAATNSKELLMKLRRKTNYSFVNCRRALEKHEYDLDKAARWLEETAVQEGWQKAAKLAGRIARQGLIGVRLSGGRLGAIVEVNCETDFVARTSKFRHLVSAITGACCEHVAVGVAEPVHSDGPFSKQIRLPVESLIDVQVRLEDKTCSIADALALSVAGFGERISFSRCAFLSVPEGSHVSGYVHPKQADGGDVHVGSYGALVAFGIADSESAALIGQQLCQHIVGMNPKSLGKPTEDPEQAAAPLAASEDAEDDDESQRTVLNDSTELLHQSFLLNPDMLVQQFLEQNDAVVLDFIRFALGEEIN